MQWDTWRHRSPPEHGGRIQSRGTRGSVGALPSREAESGIVGHVAIRLLVLDSSLYARILDL
jgi:hypothetical protein